MSAGSKLPPGAEGPEIPVLRPKEKERKGAGVPVFTGSGPGATIGVGVGGQAASVGGSLSSGFLGSARIAMAVSRALGGPGSILGGLFASPLGAPLVLGAMLAWGVLIGAAALSLVRQPSLDRDSSMSVALDSPASGLVIDQPKDRSLNYVANANQGELQWQEQDPLTPKDEPKKEPEPPQAKPEIPQPQMPDIAKLMADAQAKGLKGGRFGELTKDVSRLGGGGGLVSQLAGKQLKDGNNGFALKKTFASGGKPGKIKAFGRQMQPARGSRISLLRGRSSRALGQAKFANHLSRAGKFSTSDPQTRQFATDAFEAKVTQGGELGGLGSGVAMPPGAGVPTDGIGMTDPPAVPPTENVTPYQGNVDAARQLGDMGGMLKAMGLMMLAMGAALIAAGRALLGNPTTAPIGAALIGAGIALVITGMMMLAMAMNMANQAKNQAKKVGEADGQPEQQDAATNCVNGAIAGATSTGKACPKQPEPVTTTSRCIKNGVHTDNCVDENEFNEPENDFKLE